MKVYNENCFSKINAEELLEINGGVNWDAVGETIAGAGGAAIGGKIGASVGSAGGPVGTVVGGIVGGAVGVAIYTFWD